MYMRILGVLLVHLGLVLGAAVTSVASAHTSRAHGIQNVNLNENPRNEMNSITVAVCEGAAADALFRASQIEACNRHTDGEQQQGDDLRCGVLQQLSETAVQLCQTLGEITREIDEHVDELEIIHGDSSNDTAVVKHATRRTLKGIGYVKKVCSPGKYVPGQYIPGVKVPPKPPQVIPGQCSKQKVIPGRPPKVVQGTPPTIIPPKCTPPVVVPAVPGKFSPGKVIPPKYIPGVCTPIKVSLKPALGIPGYPTSQLG